MSSIGWNCRGGPMDGQQAVADEGVLMCWYVPARRGIGQRLIPNSETLTYDEIRMATAMYTRETMRQGAKRVDFLMYRPLPKTPETP